MPRIGLLRTEHLTMGLAMVLGLASASPALADFTVTNTNDSGAGSLRQAILDANANPGQDTISFNIPPADGTAKVIRPLSELPALVDTDGTQVFGVTQAGSKQNDAAIGSNAVVKIVLDGVDAGAGANGLHVSGGKSTVLGLEIVRFHGNGILIDSVGSQGTDFIDGNFIGTDGVSGDLGNGGAGILVDVPDAPGPEIGGGVSGRNLISGNFGAGVEIDAGYADVADDLIGTDVTGTSPIGNGRGGVAVYGGSAAISRNVISGNGIGGVDVDGSTVSFVQVGGVGGGNLIGTDATGLAPLPNLGFGVGLFDGTQYNAVDGNLVSGNEGPGVYVWGASNNVVQNNRIGADATGAGGLANQAGVLLRANGADGSDHNGIQSNTIGWNVEGVSIEGGSFNLVSLNTITANEGKGVIVASGTSNRLVRNSIFQNGDLGIDLGADGVTANDHLDLDGGANDLQNFPRLLSAVVGGSTLKVRGVLQSIPNRVFTIELFHTDGCDPSGHGEGRYFIASKAVTTNATGNAPFQGAFTGENAFRTGFITATASDNVTGSTSEFSGCRPIVASDNAVPADTSSPAILLGDVER